MRYGRCSSRQRPDNAASSSRALSVARDDKRPPQGGTVEFRRRTLLPLDDLLGCLKDSIPKLNGSSLHRCLGRYGISRLPESEVKTSKRGTFAETSIGYVHINHCELRWAAGKMHMFLAIDRVSKFTYVEFHDRTKMLNGKACLENAIAAFPYAIHTVLTDNGMAFANLPKNRTGVSRQQGPKYV